MSSRRALKEWNREQVFIWCVKKKPRVWLLPRKDRPKYNYQDVV